MRQLSASFVGRLILISLLCMIVNACSLKMLGPPADSSNPLKRVAILPFKNDTNDVDGPNFVRERFAKALNNHHYNVKPLDETDQLLRDRMGITLGGQLNMAKVEKLKEVLEVEGLLYGTLMDFKEVTVGIYNERRVRGKFKMVNALNGQVFWENGVGVKTEQEVEGGLGDAADAVTDSSDSKGSDVPWVTLQEEQASNDALQNLGFNLGKKLIAKATNTHLSVETDEMIRVVLETIPMGPGTATAASTPPMFAVPKIEMPPPPSIGHMDYGKRDFSAIMETEAINKKGEERFASKIPIAKAGKKIRLDMDYSGMMKGQKMPPALSKIVMIHRGDKEVSYSIYTNAKKYLIHKEEDDNTAFEEPEVTKTKLGKEKIDGHPTIKYRIKVKYKGGEIQEGLIWNAKDLDGMTIKSVVEDDNYKSTTLLKNVKLKTPPAHLFEIPAGFKKADGFMEIVMDAK